jgi:MFS family permease
MTASPSPTAGIRLGLRENLAQFTLLVIVNAFVGAMVGLERSILPAIAEQEFHLVARTAVLSFIVVFGVAKALTNYGAGRLSDRWGRKHVLVAGWLVAVPVPFLLMWAPDWNWVLFANVLLGVSQGLTWSTTVIMKIDLVGPRERGLAMGLNEFAGYGALAISALATGWIAARYRFISAWALPWWGWRCRLCSCARRVTTCRTSPRASARYPPTAFPRLMKCSGAPHS